jgi:vancomycin resistance protein VanJ
MPNDANMEASIQTTVLNGTGAPKLRLGTGETFLVAIHYALIGLAYAVPLDMGSQKDGYAMLALAAFMVRTFFLHQGLLLALVSVILAWRRRWKLFAAVLPLVAVTLGPELMAFAPRPMALPVGETLRVMSFNILRSNMNAASVSQEILTHDPDVVMLQEYDHRWDEDLFPLLKERFPYRRLAIRPSAFGAAIFSKRPIVESHVDVSEDLHWNIPVVQATIIVDESQVRVVAAHFFPPTSPAFGAVMRHQLAGILKIISTDSRPTILGGDFNATPRSLHLQEIYAAGMRDAHAMAGFGPGTTWPAKGIMNWLPGVRIDHILLRGLNATSSITGESSGSDHRPVIVDVYLAPSAE